MGWHPSMYNNQKHSTGSAVCAHAKLEEKAISNVSST